MANYKTEYEQRIDYLQKWFEENKNLPKRIDRLMLKRFDQCMYGNIEEVKKILQINYNLRNDYPEIFLQRDPSDEDSRKTFQNADMVPMPGLTPEKHKITFFHLCSADYQQFNHMPDTKGYIMVTDVRFSVPDDSIGTLAEGEIQIFDMTGYTLKHLTRLSMQTLRIYMKYLHQAFPARIKSIHMINCPTYLDKMLSFVKPLISKEVFKLMYFHTTGIETLYEHVPRELLPNEYGGSAGALRDLKAQFMELMLSKRDYLMNPDYWKIENS